MSQQQKKDAKDSSAMIWICLCCGVPEASVHDPTLFPFVVVVVAFRTF